MNAEENEETAAGHYRTAGVALVGMGTVGGGIAGAMLVSGKAQGGFIDATSAMAICGIMLIIGALLYQQAEGA